MSVEGTNNYDKIKNLFNKEATKFPDMVGAELDRVGMLQQTRSELEAPIDTGYMASHIEKETTGKDTVTVVATAPYSGYVDQGTWKMEAQPFFSRNVELIESQELPKIEKNLGIKIEADFAIVRA